LENLFWGLFQMAAEEGILIPGEGHEW
jgi:hypothetical protein